MGFLDDDETSGTTRIELRPGYWVDLRNCLSREQTEKAERLLTTATIHRGTPDDPDSVSRQSDTSAYRTYMVAASVVDWNLDDGAGEAAQVWPHGSFEQVMLGVRRLPERYFHKLWVAVDDLNSARTPAEQARFHQQAGGGDPAGDAGADGADEVRAGETHLAGTRTESDRFLPAPLA